MRQILSTLTMILLCAGCGDQITQSPSPEPTRWVPVVSGTEQDLVDVFFTDALTGWALCTFDSLLATTDGGATWNRYFCAEARLEHIHFTNRSDGWVTGREGELLHSTNGGQSWFPVAYDTGYAVRPLRSVYFLDDANGWIVGGTNGSIFRTTDGGTAWTRIHAVQQPPDQLTDIFFLDQSNGWAIGSRQEGSNSVGLIYRTVSGGELWEEQVLPLYEGMSAIAFTDSLNGWVAGTEGLLIHTTDGGLLWSGQNLGTTEQIVALSFTDPHNGWAIVHLPNVLIAGREYDIFRRTTDGGIHWEDPGDRVTLQHLVKFNDIQFIDPAHGWAVGSNGTIWRTVTGG